MGWKTADLTEQQLLAPAVTTPPTHTLLHCYTATLLLCYSCNTLCPTFCLATQSSRVYNNTTHSNTDKLSSGLLQSSGGVGQHCRSQLYCVGSTVVVKRSASHVAVVKKQPVHCRGGVARIAVTHLSVQIDPHHRRHNRHIHFTFVGTIAILITLLIMFRDVLSGDLAW